MSCGSIWDTTMCKNEAMSFSNSLCLSLIFGVLLVTRLQLTEASGNSAVIRAFRDRFTRTSGEEFLELWHTDCHRRCRAQLISHVSLACTFDPYKLIKRSRTKRDVNTTIVHTDTDTKDGSSFSSLFLSKPTASAFLAQVSKGASASTPHLRKKRGIMNECCYSKACSWEEYAEFCHTYNRRPAIRDTRCFP